MTLLQICFVFISISVIYVIFRHLNGKNTNATKRKNVRTLIIMGSGGHTAEMARITTKMNRENYSPRLYVIAEDDTTSQTKILDLENTSPTDQYEISKIYRSRKVGQSYFGSIFTTIYSLWTSLPVIVRFKPDLILCNGPGTCIPICILVVVARLLRLTDCRIVFIESVCRVKSLSLTGKILLRIADVFAVQWEQLSHEHKRATYFGKLS